MTQGVTSWEKQAGLSLGALAHPESALTDKRPGSSSPHGQIYLNRMHLFYYLPQTQTQIPDEE